MNRRNFLKLLGLSTLPVGLLSAPAHAEPYVTDVRHIRVTTNFSGKHRVVIDNSAEPALEDFSRYYGEDYSDWITWNFRNSNTNFYVPQHVQFFEVSEKSLITVVSPTGNKVTFRPIPDKILGHFMQEVDVDYVQLTETLTRTLMAIPTPHKLS